jgi:hypothetical protein
MVVGGMVGEMVEGGAAETAVGGMIGEMVGAAVAGMAVGGEVGVGEVMLSTDAHPVNRMRKTTWIENLNLIMIVHPDSRSLQFILPYRTRFSLRSVNGEITIDKQKVLYRLYIQKASQNKPEIRKKAARTSWATQKK